MYKIDKGIPMKVKAVEPMFPFKSMFVGDSFFVPKSDPNFKVLRNNVYHYANLVGIKVALRTKKDGIRIWRISSTK